MAAKWNHQRNRVILDHDYQLILEFFCLIRNGPYSYFLNLLRSLYLHSFNRNGKDVLFEGRIIINDGAQKGKLEICRVMAVIDKLED